MFQTATSCSPQYIQKPHAQVLSLPEEFLPDFPLGQSLSCLPHLLSCLWHVSAQCHQIPVMSKKGSYNTLTKALFTTCVNTRERVHGFSKKNFESQTDKWDGSVSGWGSIPSQLRATLGQVHPFHLTFQDGSWVLRVEKTGLICPPVYTCVSICTSWKGPLCSATSEGDWCWDWTFKGLFF